MIRHQIPNLLSLSRVFLALLVGWLIMREAWLGAVIVLWVAIATDIADGYIARAWDLSSPIGGAFDHGSDAFFVTCMVAAHATLDLAAWPLAILIPAAFTQYLLDSKTLAGQPLRASSLGRYNGIAYYVFGGWPIMQHSLGITVIPFDWFYWISWILVATTMISMADRLTTLLSHRSHTE